MKRQGLILVFSVVVLIAIVGGAWYSLASRQPSLTFAGFRYSPAEERWYADLQVRNRSRKVIHYDGYVCELPGGLRTNESMLDFQCTVSVEGKQIQSWPLWFATWLDVKPGESAKLSLNIDPNNPPRRIGLKFSEVQTPPGRLAAALGTARYYARRLLHIRIRRRALNTSEVLWCPARLGFHGDPRDQIQAKPLSGSKAQ